MSEQTDLRNRVEDLFHEANARPSKEARTAYLDGACEGKPGLRTEVEALLASADRVDSYIEKPAELGETIASSAELIEGSEIGNYKLLQQLGEGGFGVVYMAQQTQPVRRQVAIKIIKPGMDSKEVIARFEAERQALAMMDHPNISKILDAGTTTEGRPFFVMELVKGRPITKYCDANHLTTKDRLKLFVQVCNAVQHAHQKGIIHRDLKPSNVMVTLHDGKPVPKVIDFGVSKALSQQLTDKTLFTRYGQVIGTPQYMSPEQAEMSGLDIDTRSDIYSLGALLYELLTGQPPFDSETLRKAGFEGMKRLICETQPSKPSTKVKTLENESATEVANHRSSSAIEALSKVFAGDLDWIVMKTLDKDRSRRYETATGLVQDIERHLADEPVQAGPPSWAYQLSKLYRRHRAAVLASGALAAIVLLATAVSFAGWRHAAESARIAIESRARAMEQKALAEQTMEVHRQAVYHDSIRAIVLGEATEDAIARSEKLGVPKARLATLQGLSAFYAGNLPEAIKHLENAEPSVPGLTILCFAHAVEGNGKGFQRAWLQLEELDLNDEIDYLMKGQLLSVAVSTEGRALLEESHRIRPLGIEGRTYLAASKADIANRNNDLTLLAEAIREIEACNTLRPDKSFIEDNFVLIHHLGFRAAARNGDVELARICQERAEEICVSLADKTDSRNMWSREYFLADTGKFDTVAEVLLKNIRQSASPQVYIQVPIFIYEGRIEQALDALEGSSKRETTANRIARAMIHAARGEEVPLRSLYQNIVRDEDAVDVHVIALQTLLMCGTTEHLKFAQKEAARLLSTSVPLALPLREKMEFIASAKAMGQLGSELDSQFLFEAALISRAQGNNEIARQLFQDVIAVSQVYGTEYWISKYMLRQFDQPSLN